MYRQAAPFSRGTRVATPKRPGRKSGAAYGRRAHRRAPTHIDETYHAALPPQCAHCAGPIDPTRVAIINSLSAADEVCVCNLNSSFDLSQPTISHHLKILREAGLVEASRRGTWAYYRLVPEAIDALREALGA